ncbi:MAG TPA: amidohydrolase [Burkholderiales bacterium]|jgi:amidohydrolase|nr:amidohydrolase [Burkholderiales bacterium]
MNDQLDAGAQIDARAAALESRVIAWRRDLHQHPELSNREVRTAGVVAGHLQALGLKVQTGVAHTGVVGLLDTGHAGPVIALRADMDALPVTEEVDLPFASRTRTNFNGQEVGVMHACGHDCHVAILMGVAELLAGMKQRLAGSIKFIFQPAEEGPPPGEEGGAALMIRQGVLENPKPEVIFGLHVFAGVEAGMIAYRPGPTMASSDRIRVTVTGRQTHGALPWRGVDPIVISSQIVLGLQTIVSRQVDVSLEPAVVSIGAIKGGVRDNIIPDTVEMLGTVRTFNEDMREDIHARIRNTVELIARSAGAAAQVHFDNAYPVTVNDIPLTERMVPTLQRVAGADKVFVGQKITGYEDFSCYQQKIPGFFYFVGITPRGTDRKQSAPNHSPRFFVDESALVLGVRSLAHLTLDYMR